MNGHKQKRYLSIGIFGCLVGAAILFVLFKRDSRPDDALWGDTTMDAESIQTATRQNADRPSTGETETRRKIDRFREMTQRLAEQIQKADADTGTEPPSLRPSTVRERQTVREGIVLDSIASALEDGDNERAMELLRHQRALFPKETALETEALTLVEQCIEDASPTARSAAEAFIAAHGDFRLNRRIARICLP